MWYGEDAWWGAQIQSTETPSALVLKIFICTYSHPIDRLRQLPSTILATALRRWAHCLKTFLIALRDRNKYDFRRLIRIYPNLTTCIQFFFRHHCRINKSRGVGGKWPGWKQGCRHAQKLNFHVLGYWRACSKNLFIFSIFLRYWRKYLTHTCLDVPACAVSSPHPPQVSCFRANLPSVSHTPHPLGVTKPHGSTSR